MENKQNISQLELPSFLETKSSRRHWIENIPHHNRFDLCMNIFHRNSKTLFGSSQVQIDRADIILENKEFDFLSSLEAPKGWQYIYAVCDCKKGILKIGQSSKVWNRLKQHVAAFCCYGGSSKQDIKIAFSRWPVPSYLKLEDEFLSYIKSLNISCDTNGREFFTFSGHNDIGKSWRLTKKFIINLPENLPNDQ
jgi:T5orf172 domain